MPIDRQHPYSEYARKSMVMGAFANYRQGNYDEAITSAKRYLTLYPSTDDAAYAQYIIGLCYFRQIRDVTQDQKEARQHHRRRCRNWSRAGRSRNMSTTPRRRSASPATSSPARKCRSAATISSAANTSPPIKRFRIVVENYSNTRQVEEALARLTESLLRDGPDVARRRRRPPCSGTTIPTASGTRIPTSCCRAAGCEPRENAGSWISKAGKLITGA